MLRLIKPPGQNRLLHTTARQQFTFDPLRILFCGSDYFSIASLDAVVDTANKTPSLIQSIEVVARPGKWTGHKRQLYKEVPIAERARSLGLPLHSIDTFRGWTPHAKDGSNFNLILAVSFGLLIPRRIIESAKYGGLNVHPSALPDLWGAAPLQHALLDEDKHIGLTIQTLHPTKMDNGAIISQTPAPGIEVPQEVQQSLPSTVGWIAPLAANLLVRTLEQGLFQPPVIDLTPNAVSGLQGKEPRHARKLVLEDKNIDWNAWSAYKILHYQKLLSPLWNSIQTSNGNQRLVWTSGFEIVDTASRNTAFPPGIAYVLDDYSMAINTFDGVALRVRDCTVARDQSRNIHNIAQRLGLFKNDGSKIRSFMARLE